MKIFPKSPFLIIIKPLFLLSIIIGTESCIDQCDTGNGYILGIQLDTAGKATAFKYTLFNKEKDTIYKSKSDLVIMPLNINKTETTYYLDAYKHDTTKMPLTDSITFKYNTQAFNRGPDCGMDIRIKDLEIVNHSFDTAYFANKELTSDTIINVKVRLRF